jgi:ankyrin repeat protein
MKKYPIAVFILPLVIQTHITCMEANALEASTLETWVVPLRENRPPQPLPRSLSIISQQEIPEETISNFYKSIEYDKETFRLILADYPGIIHVRANYSALMHNFIQATPLYVAASVKNPSAVRTLLRLGADVNKGTEKGDSPLHRAGNKWIAKILVEEGRAIVDHKNAAGITPLHEALFSFGNQRLDVAHYLIKHRANINQVYREGNTLLHEAVCCFHAEDCLIKTTFLLERGALDLLRNDQGKIPYQLISPQHFKLMKLFYPPRNRKVETFDFFVSVVQQDDIANFEKTIDLLLDYEPDFSGTDKYGNTLLHKALLARKPDSIRFLVKHNLLPVTRNKWENTVLDTAYLLEDQTCIKALNDAVFEKYFTTPCYKPGYKALKAFLKYAFASKYKETFVRGILHYAAYPQAEIAYNQCLPLLKWGVPINLKSCPGDFPKQDDKYPYALSCAVARSDADLIRVFLDHGATVHKEMLDGFEYCSNRSELEEVHDLLCAIYKKQQGEPEENYDQFFD